jgi:hypothetical protein
VTRTARSKSERAPGVVRRAGARTATSRARPSRPDSHQHREGDDRLADRRRRRQSQPQRRRISRHAADLHVAASRPDLCDPLRGSGASRQHRVGLVGEDRRRALARATVNGSRRRRAQPGQSGLDRLPSQGVLPTRSEAAPGMASKARRAAGRSGVRIPDDGVHRRQPHVGHDRLEDSTVKTAHVVEVGDDGKTAVVTGIAAGTRVVNDGQTGVGDGEKVGPSVSLTRSSSPGRRSSSCSSR